MKFIPTLMFVFFIFPVLGFAADDEVHYLIGPSLGSINEPSPPLIATSASVKPFTKGVPAMSQTYLLDEGEGQGYINIANVEIAKTSKQCQANFRPQASVSIVDTENSDWCAIKALHAYGAYVVEDKKTGGYKIFVSKANAEYSTCVKGSTGGVKLHWTVYCHDNKTTTG